MSTSVVIVTGSDSRYFPLLRGLIASIRRKPEAAGVALGVLDCGLAADEASWCARQGARVVAPGDDVVFGPGLDVAPSYRAITARPFLPRYFPGFGTYVWIDADAWVQDWRAVSLLMAGAAQAAIAVVPEVHRSYGNLRETREEYEAVNGGAYADAFGEAARGLIRRPLNNAGVFAIRSTSPAWEIWARLIAEAAGRSTNMIDQIALNVAIHVHGLREARLPATCNWIAHLATPAWHGDRGCFVEPDLPHEAIGILHMTLGTKWGTDVALPVAGEPGARVVRSLSYEDR